MSDSVEVRSQTEYQNRICPQCRKTRASAHLLLVSHMQMGNCPSSRGTGASAELHIIAVIAVCNPPPKAGSSSCCLRATVKSARMLLLSLQAWTLRRRVTGGICAVGRTPPRKIKVSSWTRLGENCRDFSGGEKGWKQSYHYCKGQSVRARALRVCVSSRWRHALLCRLLVCVSRARLPADGWPEGRRLSAASTWRPAWWRCIYLLTWHHTSQHPRSVTLQ